MAQIPSRIHERWAEMEKEKKTVNLNNVVMEMLLTSEWDPSLVILEIILTVKSHLI